MTSSTEQTQAPPTERLLAELAELPGVVVAFSGGADSALVLAAAVRALGADRVVAATAVSSSLPMVERGPAAAFSASLGVTHHWLDTHEMDRDGYRANSGARCYFCKAELLEVLGELGRELGWPVATGTNADDAVAGFRPGIRAAAERGAITPLLSAGFDKEQVRAVSHDWQLPTWDKPAAACLSSRIAYGIGITPARLARVERAEAAVRAHWAEQAPLTDLRVRDLGEGRARLEVDRPALEAFECGAWAEPVLAGIRDAGFDQVEVRAFRSGSMNDALRSHGDDPARPSST
ncbi:ATP-dependent sacrificial sulfur transferase LarE [Microlunatus sp. Y2014]|uniref:ATP-dependent sacrificial sulfur transferase LarE n=1 Tax=Microlunatus sp. Y2014 TaxID=3418488 RepID=UPI003DA718C2